MSPSPTTFISYSWDDDAHRKWVRDLAARLRSDAIDARLDQWETVPGDQLPAFMERAIRDNQYVLIICTPRYKVRSERRQGGVGYEGDIMTAEVLSKANHRKFIPILCRGSWTEAAPSWLIGKYYVDLSANPYSEDAYQDLVTTMLGARPTPPSLGPRRREVPAAGAPREPQAPSGQPATGDVRIVGVVVDEVTEPRLDGTRGSGLYAVPFRLSKTPSAEWVEAFVATWNHPPRFSTMHRPGIARVRGDRIVLDGTTIEEVEKYHRDTLILCVKRANEVIAEWEAKSAQAEQERLRQSQEHRKSVEDVSRRIKFDE